MKGQSSVDVNPPENAQQFEEPTTFINTGAANETHQSASSQQSEGAMKNIELLTTIFQDYTPEELESEIFTLNEVMITPPLKKAATKQGRSGSKYPLEATQKLQRGASTQHPSSAAQVTT